MFYITNSSYNTHLETAKNITSLMAKNKAQSIGNNSHVVDFENI